MYMKTEICAMNGEYFNKKNTNDDNLMNKHKIKLPRDKEPFVSIISLVISMLLLILGEIFIPDYLSYVFLISAIIYVISLVAMFMYLRMNRFDAFGVILMIAHVFGVLLGMFLMSMMTLRGVESFFSAFG